MENKKIYVDGAVMMDRAENYYHVFIETDHGPWSGVYFRFEPKNGGRGNYTSSMSVVEFMELVIRKKLKIINAYEPFNTRSKNPETYLAGGKDSQ